MTEKTPFVTTRDFPATGTVKRLEAHGPDERGRMKLVADDGREGTHPVTITLNRSDRHHFAQFLEEGRLGFGWGDPLDWDEGPTGIKTGDYCRIRDNVPARYIGAGLGLAYDPTARTKALIVDKAHSFEASVKYPYPITFDVAHYVRVVKMVREACLEKGWTHE